MNRREFLGGAALVGVAAAMGGGLTGCAGSRFGFGAGGSMSGFRTAPLEKIRVGVVGCGGRGNGGVQRFRQFDCVEVTALCDVKQDQIGRGQKLLAEAGRPKAKEFLGPEAYKALCASGLCDVVYNCTPVVLHLPVAREAMLCGLHVFTEVEMTPTLEGNWELVELAERQRVHCMMLENCCYGRDELFMFSLASSGALGDITHGEAGYIHDCRRLRYPDREGDEDPWRRTALLKATKLPGNNYPTHGLGPLARAMNINHGDRFDYLVSMSARGAGLEAYAIDRFGKSSRFGNEKLVYSDMNTTLIRTVKGNTIMLQYNTSTPRPSCRMHLLQGTMGVYRGDPVRVAILDRCGTSYENVHEYFDAKKTEELRKKHLSPIWEKLGRVARNQGHDGMDFLMDARWIYCLHNGLPLDIDVYDSASWSVIAGLTQESVDRGSAQVAIPDFTRGGWKSAAPFGQFDMDLSKLGYAGLKA